MRLNLFASSLVLATSSAIEVATNDYDPMNFAQVEATIPANGYRKPNYKRPPDHCCQVYFGEGFTEPDDEPFCWDNSPDAKLPGKYKYYGTEEKPKAIKGLDCGKHTWMNAFASPGDSWT